MFGDIQVTTIEDILVKNALGGELNQMEREMLAQHIEMRLSEREGRVGDAAEVVKKSLSARLIELRGGPMVPVAEKKR